ncbi:MAG: LPS export ABC transporter permease LptF [Alphaproteobacteria bacterium]
MRAIDRYVLRQLVLATLFVTGVFTLLVALVGSLREIDFVINRGLPFTVFLELMALRLPEFIATVLPIALFIAVLFVYNRLVGDSEMVVMRAAGLGHWRLALPALASAAGVCIASYGLALYLTPVTKAAYKEQVFHYRNTYGNVLLQEGRFNTPSDGLTVYFREQAANGDLIGIFAHDTRRADRPARTYIARRGAMESAPGGARIVLFDGSLQQIDGGDGDLEQFYFDQLALDLGPSSPASQHRWQEPEERTLPGLFNPVLSDPNDAFYQKNLIAEGHRRLASPLLAIAFALAGVAALLGGEFSRRGQSGRIVAAVCAVICLYLANLTVFNLTQKNLALAPLLYLLPVGAATAAAYALAGRWRRRPSGAALAAG